MSLQVTDKSRLYTNITYILTGLQMMLPMFNFNADTSAIVTGLLLTLIAGFTGLKQRVSIEIDKKAVIFTWILFLAVVAGGVNEVVGYFHFSDQVTDGLRKGIALLIMGLNYASKTFFPSYEGKVIANKKKELKDGN